MVGEAAIRRHGSAVDTERAGPGGRGISPYFLLARSRPKSRPFGQETVEDDFLDLISSM
jgi:hypothetical protein